MRNITLNHTHSHASSIRACAVIMLLLVALGHIAEVLFERIRALEQSVESSGADGRARRGPGLAWEAL